MRCAMHIIVR